MNRMVLKVGLLALLVAAPAAWLERQARLIPSSYLLKNSGMAQAAPTVEALVLGASESFQGVVPGTLGLPAYSLANVGQSLYYDQALFEQWAPRCPRLRVVLIGLSYPSLFFHLPGSPEAWRGFVYRQVFGIPNESRADRFDLRNFSALLFYEPFKVFCWSLNGKGIDSPVLDAGGHEALPDVPEDDLPLRINAMTGRRKAAYHRGIMGMDRLPEDRAHLRAILALAAARGVRVILFVPPVTRSYSEQVDPAFRAGMKATLEGLKSGNAVLVKDYFDDPRFGDADFFDVDHLAQSGALKLSKILRAETLRDIETKAGKP